MNPYQITSSPYHRFIPSLRALKLSSLSALALSALLFSGCEVDEESENPDENPMTCLAMAECGPEQREVDSCEGQDDSCQEVSICDQTIFCADQADVTCTAAPSCGPEQREVDSCEGEDDSCQEVTMCEQTIFCADAGEVSCDAFPVCTPDSIERDSCEGAEGECYEVTECGQTTYCEVIPANPCAEEISCGEGYMEVESCEDQEGECLEATCGDETTYCAEVGEITCQAAPSCAPDELGSDEPCLDNGETCRAETMCEQTIYCRPARDVAALYCEAPLESAFGVIEPRIEGNTLRFGVEYSGGCTTHIFPGCFSDFQESSPVQVNLVITHEYEADPCDAIVSEERSLDLSVLLDAYIQAYPIADGENRLIINLAQHDTPLEYVF